MEQLALIQPYIIGALVVMALAFVKSVFVK